MTSYSLGDLVDDLGSTYGDAAVRETVGLLVAARNRGMRSAMNHFTTAAILLCYRRHAAPRPLGAARG